MQVKLGLVITICFIFCTCTGCFYDNLTMSTQPTMKELSQERPRQVDPALGYIADISMPAETHPYFFGHLAGAYALDRREMIDPQFEGRYVTFSVRNNMEREVYMFIDNNRGPTVQPGEWGRMTIPLGAVPSYYSFTAEAKDGGEDLDVDFRIDQW